jgi:hypothetical protein
MQTAKGIDDLATIIITAYELPLLFVALRNTRRLFSLILYELAINIIDQAGLVSGGKADAEHLHSYEEI